MNGFCVNKNNDAIEVFENRAGIFRLLVQDENMEVFESNINAGKSVICQPYECIDSINIMFVVHGKLFHTNKKEYIHAGDRITFKNLEETHHLSVLESTKLLVIRNSKQFTSQANDTDLVYNLIHQIQEKDEYTEDHCNSTGNLAVQIATLMKLPEQVVRNVLFSGKIHDVGKVNIPSEILNKPGSLTHEEYEIVKRHSLDGYNIIMEATNKEMFARIALDHHERLDGSGYPNKLIGDAISIEARIMAVTDSFDAMTSERPYKKAMSSKEALIILNSKSGIWYDSQVIKTLEILLTYIEDSK